MNTLRNILFVALGGALGSTFRYCLTLLSSWLSVGGEWATLAANLLGSFLIGLAAPNSTSPYLLFFTVGVCGGFTTFSTFSLQTIKMFQNGQYGVGLLYMAGTLILSLSMVVCGIWCRQKIW